MLILLVFVILLAIFGVAAARWGHDYSLEGWSEHSYDPRYNWCSYDATISEPEKTLKVTENAKINASATPKLTVKDFNLN